MAEERPMGYRELVRGNANFRLLWMGQIISLLGDWFNLIASASLVASLTQSGFAVGSLFIVRSLAPFLISPFAGVVADRYNRKRILVFADVGRAATVLGFLLVREPGDVWLLYALTAVQLGISGFFFPARNAILPDIVSLRGVGAANALTSATWSVMLAFGAALGGVVSGVWGVYPAFLIDALTFVISALVISRIRLTPRAAEGSSDRTMRAVFEQYLEGLRFLRAHVGIFVTTLQKPALILFMGAAFEVIQVVISKEVFVIGVGGGLGLGLLYATTGVGTGIGPIVARHFTKDDSRALRTAIFTGYLICTGGLLVVSLLYSFPVVLLGTLIRSAGSGVIWVFSTQLLLQTVPNRVRGRVFSTEFAMHALAGAVGASLAGAALDWMPELAFLLRVMAGLMLLAGALWALWNASR